MASTTQEELITAKRRVLALDASNLALQAMFRTEVLHNGQLKLELFKIRRPGWLRRLIGMHGGK